MLRNKPDEDDYWNNSKFKAFTFEDEDDEFSQAPVFAGDSGRSIALILELLRVREAKPTGTVSPLCATADLTDQVPGISWSIKETASTHRMTGEGRDYGFPKIETTAQIPSLPKQGSTTNEPSLRSFAPELRKPKSEYKDYISDWSPEDTVRRMQKGKPYSLESFRSLKDKLLLLDEAVQIHDGNVITAVLIFLKKSLSKVDDAIHVQDHYTLLERQIIVEGTYSSPANIKKTFKGTYSSPANIKKTFKISDKQYLLAALGARAKLKAWKDVDTLFTTKNWLGYTKKKTPIGFHRVADILHKNNAPVQVLQEYVCLVDDTDLKLNLASKYKCHDVIIDTYKDMKDRHQLMVYRCKVDRSSPEERKIDDILSNTEHQEAVNKLTETMANNSNESCRLPYDEDRIPLVVLYSIVFIIGVPANFVTVLLTYTQVRRKNVLGIYLFSLSLCDLMYLFTLPLWMSYVNNAHVWLWGPVSCKITGYVFFNNMYISIFLLCCISIDRYVAVVYAVESRGLRRQKLAAIITCIICIVVPIGHVPVFTMKEDDTGQISSRCFEPGKASAIVTGFNYARFFIGFFLPLCILIVTNYCILTNIQASTGLLRRSKTKVKCLAITVIVLFLVCFGPYHIILLLRAVMYHILEEGQNCDFGKQIYIPYTICLGLSTFNSAMNPILYVLASDNIRKELKRGLLSFRSRTSLQHRGTNSSLPKFPTSKNSVDAAQTLENNNQ
ncbi:UNVERIFIED_CONTAM: hypothetical protein FKN15_005818 [Acipenser sinensis]